MRRKQKIRRKREMSYPNSILCLLILLLFCFHLTTEIGSQKSHKDDGQQHDEPAIDKIEMVKMEPPADGKLDADLEASESEASLGGSHKILASGWPMTSQMWPSLQVYGMEANETNWPELVDPFIFTDKPHTVDYSLLLSINSTILETLKNKLKPTVANLSFEYYFSFDQRVSAKPGIKIEVERKEFKYLQADERDIKPKLWMRFNERIPISEITMLENRDWLKFSLVNRQSPSLVAIRYLKVEFLFEGSAGKLQAPRESLPQSSPMEPTYVKPDLETGVEIRGELPAASSNIKPIVKPPPKIDQPQRKSWFSLGGGRRKKRDTLAPDQKQGSIVLSCFTSDRCDWRSDSDEKIQWSLARMPPSTNEVRSGYFYLSNRHPNTLLIVHLNQTNVATIIDQESDHCIEIAIFVTESSQLDLFRLQRDLSSQPWKKGSLIFSWAPTLVGAGKGSPAPRPSLPNSRLPALENGRNGFTFERLCLGDFFINQMRDCGAGNCALGFEMRALPGRQLDEPTTLAPKIEPANEGQAESLALSAGDWSGEQVVAVALLQEFSSNRPLRQPAKWLNNWARREVSPTDSWSFYPRLDFVPANESVVLVNLFDGAHYAAESSWFASSQHLEFSCFLLLSELNVTKQENASQATSVEQIGSSFEDSLFNLQVKLKLLDGEHNPLYTKKIDANGKSTGDNNSVSLDLSFIVSDQLTNEQQQGMPLKILIEMSLSLPVMRLNASSLHLDPAARFSLELTNASLSDRCFPSPCVFGACIQNGTSPGDWNCICEDKHRGRRCQFGRWCQVAHLAPTQSAKTNTKSPTQREQTSRLSGQEFCQRKLGPGSECTEIDLQLDEALYWDEGQTFRCSCKEDFYLSDEQRCKQAHPCSSIICPAIGMICDEQRPFNKTAPCQCDERNDWSPSSDTQQAASCTRRQCRDKQRDCGFNAHSCLPTLPGEPPICKCAPRFALEHSADGQRYCKSMACTLPTLNDCHQICMPNDDDLERPYRCACHSGFQLEADGRSCRPKSRVPPTCRPSCPSDTQICTEFGCRCRQGYLAEGEVRVSAARPRQQLADLANNETISHGMEYTQSVRCLNICTLSYAENKNQFEKIEAVCPLGLCEPHTFNCRCSDPQSSALINTKYEPIIELDAESKEIRSSPLCRLRRVCEPNSTSEKICKSQGAICVPDYQKAAMFDCICPPSTEKRVFGQGTVSEFSCEPLCSSKKSDCLRRQAVCRLVDQDQARCECLPGLMLDTKVQKCYLATYSYSFNLLIANRYYQPESKFHRFTQVNVTDARLYEDNHELSEVIPQFNRLPVPQSSFITDYNLCNISQLIPKSVLDDPYERDMDTYVSYMDQCNQKIHQNQRIYSLNSKLSEDLRQSMRQKLRDFTVTTSNNTCHEIDATGMILNCTIYLQSNEPIQESVLESIFNDCDKKAHDKSLCWIKPRLLIKQKNQIIAKSPSNTTNQLGSEFNFRLIIPCELDSFCGQDAYSVQLDNSRSLCSCKCPSDIEVIDVRDLEPKQHENLEFRLASVKEICAPRNHCGLNSTFCLGKTGSLCQYDVRIGSRCQCVYPSYEDATGKCVEITFSQLDSTLIVIIIVLGAALLVAIAIILGFVARTKSFFGRSKQYPMSEFAPQRAQHRAQNSRINNRSTGVPNPVFTDD